MRLYTDLEKLVHAAHMQDVWQEAALAYKKLTEVIYVKVFEPWKTITHT